MRRAGELPGGPAGTGRTSIGLGDVQPVLGIGARGDQAEIVAMPAPGHQQAEVDCGTGNPLCRRAGPKVHRSPEGEVSSKPNSTSGVGSPGDR